MSGLGNRPLWALRLSLAFALIATVGGCYRQRAQPSNAAEGIVPLPPIEDRLGIDDVFEIRVFNENDMSGLYRVSAEGSIDFPMAGRIHVAGLRLEEVQDVLTQKLKAGYLKNPQVAVMIKSWNSRKVSVLGQVQRPGSVDYFPRMTIVDAIALAGGFTPIAAKNTVNLRREVSGKVETKVFPVADISEGRAPNIPVLPGDVVVVEERLF
jgi:protein involved in polysaccharide export with SLBB domain